VARPRRAHRRGRAGPRHPSSYRARPGRAGAAAARRGPRLVPRAPSSGPPSSRPP
jgi:hypothetical protein